VRAAVLRGTGGELTVEEVELAPPGPGRVRVRLAASGVCHSDLSVVQGVFPQPLPAVLGHEGAGTVVDVGVGVTSVQPGDHVILSWVAPCRRCRWCFGGHVELCEHGIDHAFGEPYATAGGEGVFAAFGTATFATETVVPEACAIPIDASFPLDLAALVGCGVVTGVGAVLNSARVRPGESVAVVGCGGVGLAALQGARLAGAHPIVAVDRVGAKLDLARACGASHCVDAASVDPVAAVREVTGGHGVDHALEVVGLSTTIRQAYAMARRGGTVTVVGAGRFDDEVRFGAMELMADAKTLRGCVYGATDPRRDFPAILRLHAAGAIDLGLLVTARVPLEGVNDALAAMAAGEGARTLLVLG
jgi:S-(hydroxymethyl)glutathione dehydrogenase/alcohol dehydrogenase